MVTSATEESGVIMGVRHRTLAVEAVQYHPESILSQAGDILVRNFLQLHGGTWAENAQSRVLDASLPPFPFEALKGKVQDTPLTRAKVSSVLEKIYAQRSVDVVRAKAVPGMSLADIDALLAIHAAPPLVSLVSRLRARRPALMAEIKRASPSKGDIAPDANAAMQARTYALSGASVISVLTEPTWFKGSLLDMRLARQAIDSLAHRPAVLRKDFILDEYQIAEARLHGADTVLLIVAMLAPERLKELYEYSLSIGMEPLVEVNNAREMTTALELGAKVIGVNNRNLHDFEVDMDTTSRLANMVKERDVVLCALSGISSSKDVKEYAAQGVGAVLVGEALMRAKDTRAFIHELLDWHPRQAGTGRKTPLVKICGMRNAVEARAVAEAGADLLGVVFAAGSPRRVSVETAREIGLAVRAARKDGETGAVEAENEHESWFARHARQIAARRRPLLVGVFQNQPLEEVVSIATAVELDVVQLHGKEPLEWSKHVPVPVIRVFHVDARGGGMDDMTRPGLHEAVLLDTARGDGMSGGSGHAFDWDVAASVVRAGEFGQGGAGMPLLLAGGLTAENVGEAVERVGPWGVDVSGGVETADGRAKDMGRVRAFIGAVRSGAGR